MNQLATKSPRYIRVCDLEKKSKEYWDKLACGKPQEDHYIDEILFDEYSAIERHGFLPDVNRQGGLVVLLLGMSWEPLFLSILAYKPCKLCVVYAKSYSTDSNPDEPGMNYKENFCSKIEYIFRKASEYEIGPLEKYNTKSVEFLEIENGVETSVDVFSEIRRIVIPVLKDKSIDKDKVIIDITGAKKIMSAGAYLFATFADVDVSYVDFSVYNTDYQRPYGYSCSFEILESPSKRYHLDAWRQCFQQYEDSAFGLGSKTLSLVIDQIEAAPGLFSPEELCAIKRLCKLTTSYSSWMEGDYSGANRAYEESGLKNELKKTLLPRAVNVLAEKWCVLESDAEGKYSLDCIKILEQGLPGNNYDLAKSLYGDSKSFLIYAQDELDKLYRLLKYSDDYRSICLRAASLNEMIYRYFIVQLWLGGKLKMRFNSNHDYMSNKDSDSENKEKFEKKIVGLRPFHKYVRFLSNDIDSEVQYDLGDVSVKCEFELVGISNSAGGLKATELAELRNKAIHFTVPVSSEIATKAHNLVKRSVVDILRIQNQLGDVDNFKMSYTPQWEDLCKHCNVDFLPSFKSQEPQSHD